MTKNEFLCILDIAASVLEGLDVPTDEETFEAATRILCDVGMHPGDIALRARALQEKMIQDKSSVPQLLVIGP